MRLETETTFPQEASVMRLKTQTAFPILTLDPVRSKVSFHSQ